MDKNENNSQCATNNPESKNNLEHLKMLPTRINKDGYLQVDKKKDGKISTHQVHRLVAMAFIENPENKCCVLHLDGNKQNNNIGNLKWATRKECMQHPSAKKPIRKSRTIIDSCTGEKFPSIKEAATARAYNYDTLKDWLNGRINLNPTCLQYAAFVF
jgi:hypothetical protein